MTEETKSDTKAITSADLAATKPAELGAAENKRDSSGDQSVKVRALKHFHKGENMTGEIGQPGDEFEVPRQRAAQLRANGLIEYVNEADDKAIHGSDGQRFADKVKLREEQGKIPENSRGTPLRNPEVKLAEAPAETSKQRR